MSLRINLPFLPEFKDRLLAGDKEATTRTRAFGQSGDTFEAFGGTFMLDEVIETTLEKAAFGYYRCEGFNSVEAFFKCWEKIHPGVGYRPLQKVYLHLFYREM